MERSHSDEPRQSWQRVIRRFVFFVLITAGGTLTAWLAVPTIPERPTPERPTPRHESAGGDLAALTVADVPEISLRDVPLVFRTRYHELRSQLLDSLASRSSPQSSPQFSSASSELAERWGRFGLFLMAHDYSQAAITCFVEAAEHAAADFRWVYCRAVLTSATDKTMAKSLFERALKISPQYAPAHQRLAETLFQLGDLAEAARHFQLAADQADQHPLPRVGLARCRLAQGDTEAARTILEAVVNEHAWFRDGFTELARIYFLSGQQQKAFDAARSADRLPPPIAELPDPVLGEMAATSVIEVPSNSRPPEGSGSQSDQQTLAEQLQQVQRFIGQGELQQALKTTDRLIASVPEASDAWYLRGLALETDGQTREAESSYLRCAELNPAAAEAHYALGRIARDREAWPIAVEQFQKCVAADPQFAPAHLELGLALEALGKVREAVPHVRNAVRLTPNDPYPQEQLKRLEAENE